MAEANSNKSFYLVPSDVLDHWRRQMTLDVMDKPLDKAIGDISDNIRDTVSEKTSNDLDDHNKRAHLSRQIADMNILRQQRNLAGPITNTGTTKVQYTNEAILQSIPKTYRKRAEKLLDAWNNQESFKYDPHTGTVSLNSNPVPDSNVTDLLRSAVSRIRTIPVGAREIAQYTAENIPEVRFIDNPHWRDIEVVPRRQIGLPQDQAREIMQSEDRYTARGKKRRLEHIEEEDSDNDTLTMEEDVEWMDDVFQDAKSGEEGDALADSAVVDLGDTWINMTP